MFSVSIMCCVSGVGYQSPDQADSQKGLLFSIFHAATCVFAYIHGLQLRVANIGDSRGILGHLDSGKICAVPLTSDHKVQ